jgi:adenylate cyclase
VIKITAENCRQTKRWGRQASNTMLIKNETTNLPVPQRWSLQVLGRLRLTDAAGVEIALPGRLDPALLAYLALNRGRRHLRTKLATLLWAARADSLHSLSVSLNKLRNALGDNDGSVIVRDSDPVVTDFGAMVVDAIQFEQLAALGTREALEQAEALFGGELLEGFDIRSEEFEHWLAAERGRLRDLLVEILSRLQHLRAQAGETDKAIETAHHLLGLDDLHEESHRLLMRLHQRAGRRSAALMVAQNCEEILRREKIEPEPETRRLMDEIRRSYERSGSDPVRPEYTTSDPSEALPAETNAADTANPVPGPPAPQPRFELRVRLGRHRLWVTLGAIVILVLSPVSYYHWRYWNVPWLAPYPVNNSIVWVKALLPGEAPLRIAVLPFASSGGDPEAETLARGLSEEITTALGKVSEMFVINAVSVLPYGPSPPDLRQVGRDLNVRYLLLGSVRQFGDQLWVQVQLVDANEGRQVWGNSYPGQTSDVSTPLRQITFDVITEVQVKLTEGDMERLTALYATRDLDAWLATGEGLKLLRHLTLEDNARARLLYKRAIALDPKYAGAYEGLAWTYLLDAEFGWSLSIAESLAKAGQLTQQALEIDPTKHRLYSLRGHLNLLLRNFDQAVADGERAVEAERNDADAAALLGFTLTYTGEPNRAIALVHRAIELSPIYPAWYGWALGRAYRLAGDPDRAVATLEASLPERPASVIPLVELAIAYGAAGDSGMAKTMAATIREKVPNFSIRAWAAMQPYEDSAMTEQDAAALRSAGLAD